MVGSGPGRITATQSVWAGSSWRSRRKASRTRRFLRFRMTAEPTGFPTAIPSRACIAGPRSASRVIQRSDARSRCLKTRSKSRFARIRAERGNVACVRGTAILPDYTAGRARREFVHVFAECRADLPCPAGGLRVMAGWVAPAVQAFPPPASDRTSPEACPRRLRRPWCPIDVAEGRPDSAEFCS